MSITEAEGWRIISGETVPMQVSPELGALQDLEPPFNGRKRSAIGKLEDVPTEFRDRVKLFATGEDYVNYLKQHPDELANNLKVNEKGEVVISEPLPASLAFSNQPWGIYLPEHKLAEATNAPQKLKENLVALGIAEKDAGEIANNHFHPKEPLFKYDQSKVIAENAGHATAPVTENHPPADVMNANGTQASGAVNGNSAGGQQASGMERSLPNEAERNQEQALGKLIGGFFDKFKDMLASITEIANIFGLSGEEKQQATAEASSNLTTANTPSKSEVASKTADAASRATAIDPDVLRQAREAHQKTGAQVGGMEHADQTTVQVAAGAGKQREAGVAVMHA